MNDKKKIQSNLFIGITSQILTIVLGIIIPRLTLTNYGSEVNGLLNSVTQIYSYIALLEAGIGLATVQALYKTIGNKDKDKTNAVLAATNRYYHRTGLWYLVAIFIFSVVYPLFIHTEIPLLTIILVIVLNGLGSVINYFFQAKYFLLLQAEGKNYIRASLDMFTNMLKNIAKIVLMAMGADVVFVQLLSMIISLIQMLYMTWYIKKYYSWIDLSVTPDFESISQSKNVLVHQISGLIYNNTDTITLTVFCGLKIVSVYSMYTLLFGMISTALSTVSNSVMFTIGQAFHTDKKKFLKLYDMYESCYMAIVFALYSIAYYFILPFLRVYTYGVNDIDYIDQYLPIMFIVTYLLSCGRSAPNMAINFAGHFKKTQNRAIIEAGINLVTSIIGVQFIGIYGVLLGTILALLYRTNDMIIYTSKYILKRSCRITYWRWFRNLGVFCIVALVNNLVKIDLNSYLKIIIVCIPYSVSVLAIYLSVTLILEKEVRSVIKEKIKYKC